ncbi:MAG: hypothetical protein JO248_20375, partial [Acidimicrobiia bacterium]|nr:hypothetical protein [Acidimicrobiia bacterium]
MSDVTDDQFDDDDADDANRVVGGLSKNVLDYLATSIVEEADGVVVETEERRNS